MCLMSPIFAAGTLQAENGMIQVTASDDMQCSAEVLSLCMAILYLYLSMNVPSITWQLSNI